MKKINLSVFGCLLIALLFNFGVSAQTIDEIEQYDLRSYSPVNYGLKDLVFEARISTLIDLLKERANISNIVDVYFKIYWIFPGQYQIVVEGLPQGFEELKAELREVIKERLDYVIPIELSGKLRGYNLSYKEKTPEIKIEGIDPTQTKSINRIELTFESNGKLNRFQTFSPAGVTDSKISSSVKPWSHNKWVIDSLKIETLQGQFKNTTTNRLSYTTQSGVGLPEKIIVNTVQEVIVPADYKGKIEKAEMSSEIVFSKYEVNSGKAQRFLTQGLQR